MCYHLFGCKANLGTILTIDIYFLVSVLTPDLFASGDFRKKSPSWLKILKLLSFYSGNFKIFKNALGQFIWSRPTKHVITSANCSDFFHYDIQVYHRCILFLKN